MEQPLGTECRFPLKAISDLSCRLKPWTTQLRKDPRLCSNLYGVQHCVETYERQQSLQLRLVVALLD
jgi:hypothetical protein